MKKHVPCKNRNKSTAGDLAILFLHIGGASVACILGSEKLSVLFSEPEFLKKLKRLILRR